MTSRIKLIAGNSNKQLAERMSKALFCNLANCKVSKFQDSEINVQIFDRVRNDDVFVVQSTSNPANDNLMELLIIVDALRRASAGSITAIIPYFGYARQDRRVRSLRVPITARLVADLLTQSGIDRIVTVDLHAEQIQGFFKIPVDNVYATSLLVDHMSSIPNLSNPIIISPDIGGVVRARATAKLLAETDIAIIDKRRPSANVSEVMNIIGDVQDRDCIIVDDIIDTGGTLVNAAKALKANGAARIFAYATHGVFSGNAAINLADDVIEKIVVTDTVILSDEIKALGKVEQVSMAGLLSEVIRRIGLGQSINEMYENV